MLRYSSRDFEIQLQNVIDDAFCTNNEKTYRGVKALLKEFEDVETYRGVMALLKEFPPRKEDMGMKLQMEWDERDE